MVADRAPVVGGRIHREARRQRPVHADDHVVLARAAVPRLDLATHEGLHVLKALHRVHHLVAELVLLDDPVDQGVHPRPVFLRDVGAVLVEMLELGLVKHG